MKWWFGAAFLLFFCGVIRAEVRLPSIFGDHMVLQRDRKVPIWGIADPGEQISVQLGEKRAMATAGANGKWSAALDSLNASTEPQIVIVTGKNTLTIRDVLVGDVWVCSGQSNMEYDLNSVHNWALEIPKANHPSIRFFVVGRKAALEPQVDCVGRWEVCTPKTAAKFSAVGYFFAREIMDDQKIPMGLIGAYWGGMTAQAWTSLAGLHEHSDLVNVVEGTKADLPNRRVAFQQELTAFQAAYRQWESEVQPAYGEAMTQWGKQATEARALGKLPPSRPKPPKPAPAKPFPPDDNPRLPTALSNGMIAPIVPYAMKGVIWYQGENNADDAVRYRTLFPALIQDWRLRWGQGDFPFLWVQLPNWEQRLDQPTQVSDGWPGLREAQSMTLKLPNTGQAVAIDVGEVDVHPKNKDYVAHRLALIAKKIVYGRDVACVGPTFRSMKIDGNVARIEFDHADGGLVIGAAPPIRYDIPVAPPLTELKGFVVAGPDRRFVWATAHIQGNAVLVSAPGVVPVAVRYAWANNPECNLYNAHELPAAPFRTDNWEDPSTPNAAH